MSGAGKCEKYPKLGTWVSNQHKARKNGKIKDGHFQELDSIGFVWNHQSSWETWYQLLVYYKKEHGHTNPKRIEICRDKNLGAWVNHQRVLRATVHLFQDSKIFESCVRGLFPGIFL